ncbi:hypothetical protein OTERR_20460 [Oryzomicrobium terrae]|uniref:Alpha/beta hydrolase n=1 Tax=Oryzomicrobium terrae TaxID=1735038 RepID=A0A5C1E9E7_9RHOO|nr:alpha/beta hydrolase [Oryzomicrobium terrae]QEL65522.1 hypothetical protein OTERR_20460 [Oryzomicrobium terrae]
MDVVFDRHVPESGQGADTLVVLLPGAYGTPADFIREGFVAAVRQRSLALDVALADAHLGLYGDGSVFAQIHDGLIQPARQRGYRTIWLAGISLGGLASLTYASRHQGNGAPDGVMVLAPYLGNRAITGAIAAAGGLANWTPPALTPADVGYEECQAWSWLRTRQSMATPLPVHLGYGDADRFIAGQRLMAGVLPADDVVTLPGGHDWPTWRTLWHAMLDRFDLTAPPHNAAPCLDTPRP